MHQKLTEYMEKSRENRRSHLKLHEACICIGGTSGMFKGLLAHFLNTEIPHRTTIMLCHACNNGGCSNPAHLYWGTALDNHLDQVANGTFNLRKTTDKTLAHASKLGKVHGGKNKIDHARLSEILAVIDNEPKVRGWVSRCAKVLGVSHTQVKRYTQQVYRSRVAK